MVRPHRQLTSLAASNGEKVRKASQSHQGFSGALSPTSRKPIHYLSSPTQQDCSLWREQRGSSLRLAQPTTHPKKTPLPQDVPTHILVLGLGHTHSQAQSLVSWEALPGNRVPRLSSQRGERKGDSGPYGFPCQLGCYRASRAPPVGCRWTHKSGCQPGLKSRKNRGQAPPSVTPPWKLPCLWAAHTLWVVPAAAFHGHPLQRACCQVHPPPWLSPGWPFTPPWPQLALPFHFLYAPFSFQCHSPEASPFFGNQGDEERGLVGQVPSPGGRTGGPGQEAGRHVSPLSVYFYEAPLWVPLLVLGLQDGHRLTGLYTHFVATPGHKGVDRHHHQCPPASAHCCPWCPWLEGGPRFGPVALSGPLSLSR